MYIKGKSKKQKKGLIIQCQPNGLLSHRVHSRVKLPNGEIALDTHACTVRLSASLILNWCVVCPFTKLTKALHCCFLFESTYCINQELTHWRMIGLGKVKGRSISTASIIQFLCSCCFYYLFICSICKYA